MIQELKIAGTNCRSLKDKVYYANEDKKLKNMKGQSGDKSGGSLPFEKTPSSIRK